MWFNEGGAQSATPADDEAPDQIIGDKVPDALVG